MTAKEQGLPELPPEQALPEFASAVLSRYMDGRVFSNPHTRQVARAIRTEMAIAYAALKESAK